MLEPTLVNGSYPQHASVEFNIDDDIFAGVTEISYSDGTEPGEARGTRQQPLAFTDGTYKAEGSATVYKRVWTKMAKKLAQQGRGIYGADIAAIVVNISNDDRDGDGMMTDRLVGVRVTKAEDSSSEGSDALKVKLTFRVSYIIHNGVDPVANMKK